MWNRSRVARISWEKECGVRGVASGYALTSSVVLTARHAVFDADGKVERDLRVSVGTAGTGTPAAVAWAPLDTTAPDVALLRCHSAVAPPARAEEVLAARALADGASWEATGYPIVLRSGQACDAQLERVGGRARSAGPGEGTLFLDAPTAPDNWSGLSGAAVVVDDRIVGVVRAMKKGWKGQRLEATPVSAFLSLPGFRAQVGLDDVVARRCARLGELVDRRLRQAPEVTRLLAGHLGVASEAEVSAAEVVEQLGAMRPEEVIPLLVDVQDALAGRHADAFDGVLRAILPLCLDPDLATAASPLIGGVQRDIALAIGTETLAEIALAWADGRPLLFSPEALRKGGLAGQTMVSWPDAEVGIDPDGTRSAEELARDVERRLALSVVRTVGTRLEINVPQQAAHAYSARMRGRLQGLAKPKRDGRTVYYFLHIDEIHGAERWDVAVRQLQSIPEIALVRLTGDTACMTREESEVVTDLLTILKRLDAERAR